MSPPEYLRWLMTADSSRWKPMFMGLALFAAGAGSAVLLQHRGLIAGVLMIASLAAWRLKSSARNVKPKLKNTSTSKVARALGQSTRYTHRQLLQGDRS
jgi:hypothetical protein